MHTKKALSNTGYHTCFTIEPKYLIPEFLCDLKKNNTLGSVPIVIRLVVDYTFS